MEHTGHIRIDRKVIPYHLKDKTVHLIPNNTYACLIPGDVREKEVIKGVTTGNREVAFVGCRYNDISLGYKALVISDCNTGLYSGITKFDRICFEGKPVNVFAGPGRAFISESGFDISERMKSITPKKWEDINISSQVIINSDRINIGVNFSFWHNLKYAETSMGDAIPKFTLEFQRTVNIKRLPHVYLMVYDFFCFLNFCRNIYFDKITLQQKENDKFRTIATVYVNSENDDDYDRNEHNSIRSQDCKFYLPELFKTVALRRNQKIYDNFYIPKNSKEASIVSYEKFLACALSLESEYNRLYPTKRKDNNLYADVYKVFEKSADELETLFTAIKENKLTPEEFKEIYFGKVNNEYNSLKKSISKTKIRKMDGYFEKIKDALTKIDYSLAEKYKNALVNNWEYIQPVVDKMSRANKVEFPSASEAGKEFADFRNGIAHGNPQEIEPLHVVLYEVARALIYTMVLKKANADDDSIKTVINKLF